MGDVVVVENRAYANRFNSKQTKFSLSVWGYLQDWNPWLVLGVVVQHISKLIICDYMLVSFDEELWIVGMKSDAKLGYNVLVCRIKMRS